MSAQRPQSARPAFSSREYEEAKRRVRRLDATVAGVGAGAAERRDAAPLRADGARPTSGSAAGAAGAAGTEPLPLPPRKADAAQRDADFVANLRRNIAELRECIVGRLTPYPQLHVSRFAHTCTSGSKILSYLCSREHYACIFVLPVIHIGAPGSTMLSYLFSRESSLCDSRARRRPGVTRAMARWQVLMDGDLKEMQLHMDRLFVQNQMERDRHQQQAAELTSAHEQQRAKDRQEHQGNLRASAILKSLSVAFVNTLGH
jgi:hypothetical protein